jgi:hypothetical protein
MYAYQAEYRKQNKDKAARWRQDNKENIKKYNARYIQNNKDKITRHYQDNKESIIARVSKYRNENKKTMAAYSARYERQRKAKDPLFKLLHNLRSLINISLKAKGFRKSSKTRELLGADFATVHAHLIETAIRNYGYYNPNASYHIDHIIPCSVADNEDELNTLQFYYNLQYLTPKDNLIKGSKW